MQTLWKREQTLHPAFAKINQCLTQDWFLLPHELKLQWAHAKALAAAGIFSAEETESIGRGLDQIEAAYAGRPCPESNAEDLHTWIETELTNRVGEAGKKIHTGRSRNDQVATLLRMYVIDAGVELSRDLSALAGVSCKRACDWSTLVFPLQTHAQYAAPGNVGFWVLRYATALARIIEHTDFLVAHWRRTCPLGSGAVAGSSIPIDRQIQATELGFDRPSLNALDSTSTRDECIELLALHTQTALHLQSLATDLIGFSQTAQSWTIFPPEFSTGSSMMPNKRNPDALELLRGECNAAAAAHAQAVLLMKGLPSGYNRDLQCIKPLVRDNTEKMEAMCALTCAFLERLDFDADRMASSASMGSIDATLRMERQVLHGIPLRDAHHAMAAELRDTGVSQSGAMEKAIDAYRTSGSANPEETRRIADKLLADLGDRA